MTSVTKIYHHTTYPTLDPSRPENSHDGRTILITGGAEGIGYSIGKAFLKAGANLVITGRRLEKLQQASQELSKDYGGRTTIHTFSSDISSTDSVENLWKTLEEQNITIDVLVLNAGATAPGNTSPLLEYLPQMRSSFDANLFGNALMATRFQKQPGFESKPRALLNISSAMAHANPAPHQAAYATSKGAFAHTLQLLADEVRVEQCQIINIQPGAIRTASIKDAPKHVIDQVIFDEHDLPGSFAVWAASPAAKFLHGRFIWANWDMDELTERKSEFEDAGFLKLGLQGADHLDIRTHFDKIREADARRT